MAWFFNNIHINFCLVSKQQFSLQSTLEDRAFFMSSSSAKYRLDTCRISPNYHIIIAKLRALIVTKNGVLVNLLDSKSLKILRVPILTHYYTILNINQVQGWDRSMSSWVVVEPTMYIRSV